MNYSMFRVERRVRSAPLLVLSVLFAALVGCGNSGTNGSLTDCDIVVQIRDLTAPPQPAGSDPLFRNGQRLLNDLAATTHDYRAQCPVN